MADSMFTISGQIDSETVVDYMTATKGLQEVSIYINSPGGRLDSAKIIADDMRKRQSAACYVNFAASAALEIIMPACTTITIREDAVLKFHQVHVMFGPDSMMSSKDLRAVADDIDKANAEMVKSMSERFPLIPRDLLAKHFYEETRFTPKQLPADVFTTMFTRILTLEEARECLPFNMNAGRVCPKN